MRVLGSLFVLVLLREATGAVVRKPPAFSKPMYSDGYLPAAMQIIFHAVEQLKQLDIEETTGSNVSTAPSPATPMLHTAQNDQTTAQTTSSSVPPPTTPRRNEEPQNEKDDSGHERPQEMESSVESNESDCQEVASFESSSTSEHLESPEINEETPETNYATPEVNYELPEMVHAAVETNHEVPEDNQEADATSSVPQPEIPSVATIELESSSEYDSTSEYSASKKETTQQAETNKKKEPTIDSIVEEIYEIVKPTPSMLIEEDTEVVGESKSSDGMSVEKVESIEEEEEETRFTLLGEKVAQVPRPSLSSYLRRAKVPPSVSLQLLASLYDALSKDARKQGYGRYTGYSDEVLRTLETSAEGGVGPQMKRVLEKIQERNELTREDARTRTSETLRGLDDPSSALNKDLRRVLPLRYSP